MLCSYNRIVNACVNLRGQSSLRAPALSPARSFLMCQSRALSHSATNDARHRVAHRRHVQHLSEAYCTTARALPLTDSQLPHFCLKRRPYSLAVFIGRAVLPAS
eukprot:5972244-Pleurochrysis_carterae.AAC.4